jgi:GT2 family glycosyltransferase
LKPCLKSILRQTAQEEVQIIVADNGSVDAEYLEEVSILLAQGGSQHLVVNNGGNLGYCGGNNAAAKYATGRFLFFLNPDTWLEPRCVEHLLAAVNDGNVAAAQPLVMEYEGHDIVAAGRAGIDLTGLSTPKRKDIDMPGAIFVVVGCSFFIRRDVFEELGGFDSKHFMYVEEDDLSWRLWLSGHSAILVPTAICHHRGCNAQNPAGGGRLVELRTSPFVRYQNNRNSLLMIAKNGQHVMLLMLFTQLLMLAVEALVTFALFRKWSYVRKAYVECIADAWHLRRHVVSMRRKIKSLRKRSDWWILRHFLNPFYFNRFEVFQWIQQRGLPKMS